jgi:hypothetical protein
MSGAEGAPALAKRPVGRTDWAAIVPDDEWAVYMKAIRAVRPLGTGFLLGGAFGLASYTGRWRNTKDLDFYVLPSERDRFIDALLKAGFVDYYDTLAYDRGWIFRAVQDDVIVDVIWGTPNRRSEVDAEWFKRGTEVTLKGEKLAALPAEELLFVKSFVLQRDRCDWPDLLNLLCYTAGELDWDHVVWRYGPELPILKSLLNLFAWLNPEKAALLPEKVRTKLGVEVKMPTDPAAVCKCNVALLDSRAWFAPFHPTDKPMWPKK